MMVVERPRTFANMNLNRNLLHRIFDLWAGMWRGRGLGCFGEVDRWGGGSVSLGVAVIAMASGQRVARINADTGY